MKPCVAKVGVVSSNLIARSISTQKIGRSNDGAGPRMLHVRRSSPMPGYSLSFAKCDRGPGQTRTNARRRVVA